jgi:hypothetical protein
MFNINHPLIFISTKITKKEVKFCLSLISLTYKGHGLVGGLRNSQTFFSSSHFRNLECHSLTSFTSKG